MLITSKFNSKGLWLELIMYLLAPLTLMTFSLGSRRAIFVTIVVAGVLLAIALCIWAFRLKTIVVTDKELEVKHTCLPFLKRFYRLTEFDSYIIEEEENGESIYLLYQGKRAVKLSSKIYENYAELKEALSSIELKDWGADASRAVDSAFAKSHLFGLFLWCFFSLLVVVIPVTEYIEDGQVTMKSYLLSLMLGIVFLPILFYLLSSSKRLTIWRGYLEAKSLLSPWKTNYYALCDFDFALEVVTPSQFENEKSLWLIRDNKLAISIPKSVYANYDVLEHAIGIVPSDTIKMSYFKKLKYHLGKATDF
ncbi:MAG: hypothetical protein J6T78_10665 [Bacteroidaceae bacterium]|nr:hypothetical protein [Bacteroidaceae bacterium]